MACYEFVEPQERYRKKKHYLPCQLALGKASTNLEDVVRNDQGAEIHLDA